MKLISWNVNGIRACITKGFEDRFHELDADVFCLQETKCQQGQVKLELPGYYQYWNYANRRGYSGTAVFTKKEPVSVAMGIGIEEHDQRRPRDHPWSLKIIILSLCIHRIPRVSFEDRISYGMGKGFSGISSEASGEEACDLLWRP